MRKAMTSIFGSLCVVLSFSGASLAAPQVLALVASADAVSLECSRGQCSAEFSTICLQPHRASPVQGKTYRVAGDTGVTLIATTTSGEKVRLSPDGIVNISALRGHNSIEMTVAKREMEAKGFVDLSVEIADNVSLVPTPIKGDPNPLDAADIALASGPLRQLATKLVDQSGTPMATAAVTRDVINSLPRNHRTTANDLETAWQFALGRSAAQASAEAVAATKSHVDACKSISRTGVYTMRQCLGAKHDSVIGDLNDAYWAALNSGS